MDDKKIQRKEVLCYPKHLLLSGNDVMFSFEELKAIPYLTKLYDRLEKIKIEKKHRYNLYVNEEIRNFKEEIMLLEKKRDGMQETLYQEIDEFLKIEILKYGNLMDAALTEEISEEIENKIKHVFETKINTIKNMSSKKLKLMTPQEFFEGNNSKSLVYLKDLHNNILQKTQSTLIKEKMFQAVENFHITSQNLELIPDNNDIKVSSMPNISQQNPHKKAMLSVIYENSREITDQSSSIPSDSSKTNYQFIGSSLNSTSSTSSVSTKFFHS